MSIRTPSVNSGRKKGKPITWSQCAWLKSRWMRRARSAWSRLPARRMPVPASMRSGSPGPRTSRQVVSPPWRTYSGPETEIDPRAPQTVTSMAVEPSRWDGVYPISQPYPSRFLKRSTARVRMPTPKARSTATCGQSTAKPLPLRKIPRTITRK